MAAVVWWWSRTEVDSVGVKRYYVDCGCVQPRGADGVRRGTVRDRRACLFLSVLVGMLRHVGGIPALFPEWDNAL